MTHVLILYNQPILPVGHPQEDSECEILQTIEHVAAALTEGGHHVTRLALVDEPAGVVEQIRASGPDAVFNLFEGIPDRGETETCVAAMLEWLRVPFTGSPSRTLALARDKPLSKLALAGAGLPTPEFLTVSTPDDPRLGRGRDAPCSARTGLPLRWPLFVKPAEQDASVGIDQNSVAPDAAAMRRQVSVLCKLFGGSVLIEEYVPGRELTVSVINQSGSVPPRLRTLPVSEYEFDEVGDGWPIVTYDFKWQTDSTTCSRNPYRELADVSPELVARLSGLALRVFEVLGLRDYGRIDFRVTPAGEPYILEANPNPDLNPTAGLPGVLRAAGLNYVGFINGLVDLALRRRR